MTNDEIPNDERSPNDEIRMTNAGSAGVAVMAGVGARGSKKTFNIQRSTFNVQHSTFNIQRSTLNVQLLVAPVLLVRRPLNIQLRTKNQDLCQPSSQQHRHYQPNLNVERSSLPPVITVTPALPVLT